MKRFCSTKSTLRGWRKNQFWNKEQRKDQMAKVLLSSVLKWELDESSGTWGKRTRMWTFSGTPVNSGEKRAHLFDELFEREGERSPVEKAMCKAKNHTRARTLAVELWCDSCSRFWSCSLKAWKFKAEAGQSTRRSNAQVLTDDDRALDSKKISAFYAYTLLRIYQSEEREVVQNPWFVWFFFLLPRWN